MVSSADVDRFLQQPNISPDVRRRLEKLREELKDPSSEASRIERQIREEEQKGLIDVRRPAGSPPPLDQRGNVDFISPAQRRVREREAAQRRAAEAERKALRGVSRLDDLLMTPAPVMTPRPAPSSSFAPAKSDKTMGVTSSLLGVDEPTSRITGMSSVREPEGFISPSLVMTRQPAPSRKDDKVDRTPGFVREFRGEETGFARVTKGGKVIEKTVTPPPDTFFTSAGKAFRGQVFSGLPTLESERASAEINLQRAQIEQAEKGGLFPTLKATKANIDLFVIGTEAGGTKKLGSRPEEFALDFAIGAAGGAAVKGAGIAAGTKVGQKVLSPILTPLTRAAGATKGRIPPPITSFAGRHGGSALIGGLAATSVALTPGTASDKGEQFGVNALSFGAFTGGFKAGTASASAVEAVVGGRRAARGFGQTAELFTERRVTAVPGVSEVSFTQGGVKTVLRKGSPQGFAVKDISFLRGSATAGRARFDIVGKAEKFSGVRGRRGKSDLTQVLSITERGGRVSGASVQKSRGDIFLRSKKGFERSVGFNLQTFVNRGRVQTGRNLFFNIQTVKPLTKTVTRTKSMSANIGQDFLGRLRIPLTNIRPFPEQLTRPSVISPLVRTEGKQIFLRERKRGRVTIQRFAGIGFGGTGREGARITNLFRSKTQAVREIPSRAGKIFVSRRGRGALLFGEQKPAQVIPGRVRTGGRSPSGFVGDSRSGLIGEGERLTSRVVREFIRGQPKPSVKLASSLGVLGKGGDRLKDNNLRDFLGGRQPPSDPTKRVPPSLFPVVVPDIKPDQGITPKLKRGTTQTPAQVTSLKQLTDTGFFDTSLVPSKVPRTPPPIIPFPGLPGGSLFGLGRSKRKRKSKQPLGLTPSFTAITLQIFGKSKKTRGFSGFELRPIPVKNRRLQL